MRIAIAGASGLVGSAITPHLESKGHTVLRLVRREAVDPDREITWRPNESFIDSERLKGVDVIINLAGENIASGRWTDEKKRRILESRVNGTRLIAETIAGMEKGPRVFLAASASGYYGHRGDEVVDEDSPNGDDFLAEVCRKWEEASRPAADAGIRVVNFRLGVVMTPDGGMLAKVLPIFKLGLGGKISHGDQYMPWITLDDIAVAVDHLMHTGSLEGPVNLVSPLPVTNAEFTETVGRILGRPTIFTVPAFALKIVIGEMAVEALKSCRAVPKRLAETGFEFIHPALELALRDVLERED